MLKRICLSLPLIVLLSASALAVTSPSSFAGSLSLLSVRVNDREQDGLVGPVRRVRTETAKLSVKEGKVVEGPRKVLESATYDIKGAKIDNQYFLAAGGSLTGKEVYKYDDKGNITEMALFNGDGTLLSKEVYAYEFDAVGNWTKMTTSVAVFEGGKVNYEPSEITYRAIAYYLEENTVAKLTQANAGGTASQPAATSQNAAPSQNAVATNVKSPATNDAATAQLKTDTAKAGAALVQTSLSSAPASASSAPASASRQPSKVVPSVAPAELAALDKSKTASVAGSSQANASGAPVVKDDAEAPPPRLAARAPVKPISGGVLNGKALKLPPPTYPLHAKSARVTGTVMVEVVIDVTGKVISAEAVSGPPMLHQAAEQAAKQARFSPTLLSGSPVKISGTISYNFTFQE